MKPGLVCALLGIAAPAFCQYAGPAVLSRGEAPAAMRAPQIDFRPFLEFNAIYDTGLANVGVTDTGQLARASSIGMSLGWGVSGLHSWRHTTLGVDYSGTASHYTRQSAFDTIDQSILIGLTHRLTRHIALNIHETAGWFSRDAGLLGLPQTVPFDPTTTEVPTTDFFDNRTLYSSTSAGLTFQKTARLSFNFGGELFVTRRRSKALYGAIGEGANADVQYRVGRRTTIGGVYTYGHYGFSHVFGGTDFHGVAFTFARSLTPKVEFTGSAGAYRAESKFVESVPVDPAIAALFGVQTAIQVVHSIAYLPNLSARLSRTFSRGVAYLNAGHSITPGNGLFLTSYATTVGAGYSYTGQRRWSFGTAATYSNAKSIANFIGGYRDVGVQFSASRQLIRSIHFVSGYAAHKYLSNDFHIYNRIVHSANIGLGWTPGDIPLRVW